MINKNKLISGVIFFNFLFVLFNPLASFFTYAFNAEDPDEISINSLVEMETLAEEVNAGNTFEGKCIKLKKDINLTADGSIDGKPIKFLPIGFGSKNNKRNMKNTKYFNGTFDGNGHTIHCNISGFTESGKSKGNALFGALGKEGVIKKLNLSGSITSKDDKAPVAGICDINHGLIENCNTRATVNGCAGACGICSKNYGVVKDCKVRGKIMSSDYGCAGVALINYNNVFDCNVATNITNCYNKALLETRSFQNPETGGVCAFNFGKISNCSVNAQISNKNINSDFNYESYLEAKQPTDAKIKDGAAGGIVAVNNGLVEKSSFKGSINGFKVGGCAAKNYNVITDCSVDCKLRGVIVGGAVAKNIAGDKEVSGEFIVDESETGQICNCTISGEATTFFLGGGVSCTDYWDDPKALIDNCNADNLKIIYIK